MTRINTNINSLQAQRALRRNNDDLSMRLNRLSTGLKINNGADAPAGLIASETLRSEMEGIKQAIVNSSRAKNVINTAEGSLAEVSSLMLELQSLTNEAANTGALSKEEIEANQLQVDEILTSINRIANTTQFNGRLLLNGQLDYQLSGVTGSQLVDIKVNAAKLPDNAGQQVNVQVTGSAQTARITYSAATTSTNVTLEVGGKDGVEQLSFASGTAISAVAFAMNQVSTATGVSATVSGAYLHLDSTEYGSESFVTVDAIDGSFTTAISKDFGQDASVNINGAVAEADGLVARGRSGGMDIEIRLDATFAQTVGSTSSFDITGGGTRFQIGSSVQRQGQISIGVGSVATSRLGNNDVGFMNELASGGANSLVSGNTTQAQRIIKTAIQEVATLRGRLGAVQKTVLETNINSLSVAMENVTAAESMIRDADFAMETAALTRAQILTQANTSVLAQANQSPQQVLQLLQG